MKFFWLVVWNIFPYLGNTHPNWRTLHIFQRGGSTTNQMRCFLYDPLQIHHPWRLFSSQGASCWQCRRRARSRDFTQWWIEAAFEWWMMVDLGYKILGVKNPMKFEDAQTNNKWESDSPNDSPNETDSESIPHVMGRSALNEGGRSAGSDDAQGHPGALPCQWGLSWLWMWKPMTCI